MVHVGLPNEEGGKLGYEIGKMGTMVPLKPKWRWKL